MVIIAYSNDASSSEEMGTSPETLADESESLRNEKVEVNDDTSGDSHKTEVAEAERRMAYG